MLVRKKIIRLDEAATTATIGALSFGQIEAFAAQHIKDPKTDAERKQANEAIWGLVAEALNNGESSELKWTPERIHREMDPGAFQKLFDAVLELSMLSQQGEAAAAEPPSASPSL